MQRNSTTCAGLIGAPASQAYVERIFSLCGILTSGRRNAMKKSLAMRVFLKLNKNILLETGFNPLVWSKTLENEKHDYNNLKLSRWQTVLLLTPLAMWMFVFRIDGISGIDSITAIVLCYHPHVLLRCSLKRCSVSAIPVEATSSVKVNDNVKKNVIPKTRTK